MSGGTEDKEGEERKKDAFHHGYQSVEPGGVKCSGSRFRENAVSRVVAMVGCDAGNGRFRFAGFWAFAFGVGSAQFAAR